MSDGRWIKRGTLDYWHDRDMVQRDRIRELEAKVEKLRGDLMSARDYAVQVENERDDAKAENAHLAATVEAYEDMKAQMDADGGPGVMRRQLELRRYKVRAERAEAELAALREGRGEPVAWRYRYLDPISGNPVWCMSGGEWNGQLPREAQPLYASPAPVSVGEAAKVLLCDQDAMSAMCRAAAGSRAHDDEGEFEPLMDLIGFSGENKTRAVIFAAIYDALCALAKRED